LPPHEHFPRQPTSCIMPVPPREITVLIAVQPLSLSHCHTITLTLLACLTPLTRIAHTNTQLTHITRLLVCPAHSHHLASSSRSIQPLARCSMEPAYSPSLGTPVNVIACPQMAAQSARQTMFGKRCSLSHRPRWTSCMHTPSRHLSHQLGSRPFKLLLSPRSDLSRVNRLLTCDVTAPTADRASRVSNTAPLVVNARNQLHLSVLAVTACC